MSNRIPRGVILQRVSIFWLTTCRLIPANFQRESHICSRLQSNNFHPIYHFYLPIIFMALDYKKTVLGPY